MIAAIYSMTLTMIQGEKKVSSHEFIVVGNDENTIDEYAESIRLKNVTTECTATLDGPFQLDNIIYGEVDRDIIDWARLSLEVEEKRKRKPQGLGSCSFRGMWSDEAKKDWDESNDDFKDSISHFLPKHRRDYYGEEFYFIGAITDDITNKLIDKAIIIRANNLDHAADICQLFYFDKGPVTVFTEWCCPIFQA